MNKTILERILDSQREFRKTHQKDPVAIHLTPEDETKIGKLSWNELGTLLEPIIRNGVRATLPTIYGMRVVYDSLHFSLE